MSEYKSEIIDIRGILRKYLKKWYWFVISPLVCVGLGLVVSLFVQPKYEVRANVMLTEQSSVSKFLGSGLSGVSQLFGGNASAEDEVQIMTSHSVLRSVVKDLGLNQSYARKLLPRVYLRETEKIPLSVIPDPEINIDTLRRTLTFIVKVKSDGKADIVMFTRDDTFFKESNMTLPADITTGYGKFRIEATPFMQPGESFKERVMITGLDIAAENLKEELNVSLASKHSQIVEMQMMTDNEQYAIDVLNTLIRNYNDRSKRDQDQINGATARFIDDRLKAVRASLNDVEAEMASYKQNEGFGMLEADGTVMYERLTESEKALTQQQVATEMLRITLELARESAKDNSLIPPIGENDGLAALISSYNALVLRRVSVEGASKADNIALQRLDEQIRLMRKNLITSLESAYKSSQELESEFRRVYNDARSHITGLPTQEYSYRQIARNQAIEEQIYIFLLQKQEETNVLFSNLNPKAQIIDEAYSLNEDESMSTTMIVLISIILGLIIPPVWFFCRDYFKNDKNVSVAGTDKD